MKKKIKLPKPPRPEVCDACLTEGNLFFNSHTQEWLCNTCNDLIKRDRRDFDFADGKKFTENDMGEW